jgi:pimeloyl-ACP methyl ester carboxylesterase
MEVAEGVGVTGKGVGMVERNGRDAGDGGPVPEDGGRRRLGRAGKAAAGLGAAAVAAYTVYLLGARRSRRAPVTELPNALEIPVEYVKWGDVYYAHYHRPGVGRPVVFLHSINAVASAHEMRPLVRAFRRYTDRPIHALEWVGFGHSDRPEIVYDPSLMEDQLEHFLERVVAADGGADVVGLSLGATYAAAVGRRRPELVHALAAIEPFLDGTSPAAMPRIWSSLLFSVPGVQRAFYDRLTTPEALYEFASQNLFTPEFGVPEDFVEYGAETSKMDGAARPLDDFLRGRLFPKDTADSFRRLRRPLLVVHGTVASRRQETYARLPELDGRDNVTVVALPTGGLPHWERAREVWERVRDFFDDASTAS